MKINGEQNQTLLPIGYWIYSRLIYQNENLSRACVLISFRYIR